MVKKIVRKLTSNQALIDRAEAIRVEREMEKERIDASLNYRIIDMHEFLMNHVCNHSKILQYGEVFRSGECIDRMAFTTNVFGSGCALRYGKLTKRMCITTDPRVAYIIKNNFRESSYTLIGTNHFRFRPIEGKTTHIDLYSDSNGKGNWFECHELMFRLVAIFGFVVSVIEPPFENTSWTEIFNNNIDASNLLINARKKALDFSYFWDETIFE